MEGGGDGHDIHLQVPVVLKSIFQVQNEDSLKTGWGLSEFWFQGPPHQVLSPPLPPAYAFPPFSCVPKCIDLFLFQTQFLDLHLATGVVLGAKSRRRGHGSRGWMRWQLCHACAVLQTWTHLNQRRKHALRNRQGTGPAEPGNDFTSTWPKFLVASHSHLLLLCFDGVNERKTLVLSDSPNSCLPQLEKSGL